MRMLRFSFMFYKLLTIKEKAEILNPYRGSKLDIQDGFIHLSLENQVHKTANRYFQEHQELVLMLFNGDVTMEKGIMNGKETDEVFPHFYGAIDISKCEFRQYKKECGLFPPINSYNH
jgi:uncharacterized protein (DUF952 family)